MLLRATLVAALFLAVLWAQQISVNITTLPSTTFSDVLTATPVKVVGSWPNEVVAAWSAGRALFVYDGVHIYRYIYVHDKLTLTSTARAPARPALITEGNNFVLIVLLNGTVYKADKALLRLSKLADLGQRWYVAGEINGSTVVLANGTYVYLLDMNNGKVKKILVPNGKILLYNSFTGDVVPIDVWRVEVACGAPSAQSVRVYYFNNTNFVALYDGKTSYLAKITFEKLTPKLASCKKYRGVVAVYKNYIEVSNATTTTIILHDKTKIVVEGASNATLLQTLPRPYVAVIKADSEEGNYILVLNRKYGVTLSVLEDSVACASPSNVLICMPQSLIYKPTMLANLTLPYDIVNIVLSKKMINVIGTKVVVINLKELTTLATYKKTVTGKATFQAPAGVYLASLATKVGKVVEFLFLPPPSTNFDPRVVNVVLTPETIIPYIFKLTIYTYDAQTKKPLPNTFVYIVGKSVRGKEIRIGPLITDNDGKVSIYLEKGTYVVRAEHEYYKPAVKRIVHDKPQTLKFYLMLNGVTVNIKVISEGASPFIPKGPIPGALVSVSNAQTNITGKTDKTGTFKVVLLPGTYTLKVTAPKHEPYTGTLIVPKGKKQLDHEVKLKPLLYKVTLIIKDAFTGRGVTPDIVIIKSLDTGKSMIIKNPVSNVITVNLPPGTYEIQVNAKGYVTFKRVYTINKNAEIIIPLKFKTIKVKILVFDEFRKPVPAYNVTLINNVLGLKFNFSLTETNNTVTIPPGTYTIKVTAKGFEPLVTTVEITENTQVLQLTIAHKSFTVEIKAVTNDKMLYDYIAYCTGNIQGGPFFKPIPLPKMTKPALMAKVKLPRGTYQVSLSCYSATKKLAATGIKTFSVPLTKLVEVRLSPTKTYVEVTVLDVRTNRPVARATVKFYSTKGKLIGEGMTNVAGIAKVAINSYWIGKTVILQVSAPGYQEYKTEVILAERLPPVYLKPAPTLIEIILGNPILLILLVIAAGAGAYLISLAIGKKEEEEEIFEELV